MNDTFEALSILGTNPFVIFLALIIIGAVAFAWYYDL